MMDFLRKKWCKWTERAVRLPIGTSLSLKRPGSGYGGWIIPAGYLRRDSVVYPVVGYTIAAKEPECHNYTLIHKSLV